VYKIFDMPFGGERGGERAGERATRARTGRAALEPDPRRGEL